jgi:hypothetical protein
MRSHVLFLCGVLICGPALAAEELPGTERNDKGELIWKINDYLHGTTADVATQLNRDVDSLAALIRETQKSIDEDSLDLSKDEAATLKKLKSSQPYRNLQDELTSAEAAKQQSSGSDRLAAATREGKARKAIAAMESAAENSTVLKDDRQALTAEQGKMSGHQAALTQAMKWRANLRRVIRETYMLEAPLRKGEIGVLTSVDVSDVGSDLVAGVYNAPERASETDAKKREGYSVVRVTVANVNVVIPAIDGAKPKHLLTVNRTYEVVSAEPSPDGVNYVLRPHPCELDDVLQAAAKDPGVPTTQPDVEPDIK